MPVRINVGVAKKVGQPNFGSAGATCNVEFELDGGFDNGSTERFQDAVRRACLLYTSPSPRDQRGSRMPSSA